MFRSQLYRTPCALSLLLIGCLCATGLGDDPVERWKAQVQRHGAARMEWNVIKDSRRDASFGFERIQSPVSGQLNISETQARLDIDCLAILGIDSRYYPQKRSTVDVREEFRRILLEDKLSHSFAGPVWKPISLELKPGMPLLGRKWGGGTRLAALAPLLAEFPSFAFAGVALESYDLSAHHFGEACLVYKAIFAQSTLELWLSPQCGYRIVRCFLQEDDHKIGQIDVTYDPSGNAPIGWTVIEFEQPTGFVLDFVVAEVTKIESTISDEAFKDVQEDGGLNLDSPTRLATPYLNWIFRNQMIVFGSLVGIIILSGMIRKSRYGRSILIVSLLLLTCFSVARLLPITDAPLGWMHEELLAIRAEIDAGSAQSGSTQLGDRLSNLSFAIERSQQLGQTGIWASIFGQSTLNAAVRREMLQLAKNDLPSYRDTSQKRFREETVRQRFDVIESLMNNTSPVETIPYRIIIAVVLLLLIGIHALSHFLKKKNQVSLT